MRKPSALPGLIFVVIFGIGLAFAYFEFANSAYGESVSIAVGAFLIAIIVSYSIKIADQWNRAVVLRLGRFRSLEGPGLFFIIPIIETVPYWIAAIVLVVIRELGLPEDIVNVDGGAIAHGHPIGATGAVLTTRLLHAMRRDGIRRGLVTPCIGGGQGVALALEAVRCNINLRRT
jgi:hypothetical protein